MLHLHARDPETGRPDQSPRLFEAFLSRVKQSTNAILNITTGGGLGMSLDERLAAAKWAKPEVASMNMGSINFNISGAGSKIQNWLHDWEKPYLEMTRDFIRSEEHTSELQSLMRISYAVFCLKKQNKNS